MRRILIILVCVFMAQNVFGVTDKHHEYEERTRNLFGSLATQLMINSDARITRDVLDDVEIDDGPWRTALADLHEHFLLRPSSFPWADFWEVGAETTVTTALNYKTRRYDNVRAEHESSERTYKKGIKNRIDRWSETSDHFRVRLLNNVQQTTSLILMMKFDRENNLWSWSDIAFIVLKNFRAEIGKLHPLEQKTIVRHPFRKKLFQILKYVDKENAWPDEVKTQR